MLPLPQCPKVLGVSPKQIKLYIGVQPTLVANYPIVSAWKAFVGTVMGKDSHYLFGSYSDKFLVVLASE